MNIPAETFDEFFARIRINRKESILSCANSLERARKMATDKASDAAEMFATKITKGNKK